MSHKKKNIQIASYQVERDWLYAPSTYLIDSFLPCVEEIFLPITETKKGELILSYVVGGKMSCSPTNLFGKAKHRVFSKKLEFSEGVFLDLREHSPQNIAHAVMIHLAISLWVKEFLLGLGQGKPILIFPKSLPHYVAELFREIGFDLILTNNTIVADICTYEIDLIIELRGGGASILQEGLKDSEFSEKVLHYSKKHPKKIFLSRKDTRKLSNEAEVELFLKERGYQKIYLEDYSILDQVALVSQADNIVAVHGAALGTLILQCIFDRKDKKPLEVVEIFSPAHMTNVYRIITQQIGGKWVGVRGKVWPKLIKQAYECDADKVRQFSLFDFEVCLLSLNKALEKVSG